MKILRVYCNLVDGSMLPFYPFEYGEDDALLERIMSFAQWVFQHEPGKIDIDTTGKQLTIELLDTDDFGPPPLALNIKVENEGKMYEIRVPYKKERVIYLAEVEDERFG